MAPGRRAKCAAARGAVLGFRVPRGAASRANPTSRSRALETLRTVLAEEGAGSSGDVPVVPVTINITD